MAKKDKPKKKRKKASARARRSTRVSGRKKSAVRRKRAASGRKKAAARGRKKSAPPRRPRGLAPRRPSPPGGARGLDEARAGVLEFVIMLDHLLAAHPAHWPISEQADTLAAARAMRQHRGNPEVIPRSQVAMQRLEDKSLIDAETGRVDPGAIFQAE